MTKYQYHGPTARQDIYKTLSKIEAHGYSFGDIYRDWLELMTAGLCGDEEAYLATMKRYERENSTREKGQRPADRFAEAYGKLCLAWRADNADHLGAIYEEFVSHGEHGQFFTPEHLCTMMAQMTMGDREHTDIKPGQSICDPACGSGRNLIAAAQIQPNAKFYGIDVDRRCVQMTALNMVHRNLDAIVVWGNALSLEQHGAYISRSTPLGATLCFVEKDHEIPQQIMGRLPKEQKRSAETAREHQQSVEAANEQELIEQLELML